MSWAGGAGPDRIPQRRYSMLEPDALKGARPVLRGGGGGDLTSLPDYRKAIMGRNLLRAAFVVGVILAAQLAYAVYDGRQYGAAVFGLFGVFCFAALPAVVTWPGSAPEQLF